MLVLSREPSNKCGSTKCPRRDRHKERGVNEVKGEKTRKNTRDLQCGRSDEKENSKRAFEERLYYTKGFLKNRAHVCW